MQIRLAGFDVELAFSDFRTVHFHFCFLVFFYVLITCYLSSHTYVIKQFGKLAHNFCASINLMWFLTTLCGNDSLPFYKIYDRIALSVLNWVIWNRILSLFCFTMHHWPFQVKTFLLSLVYCVRVCPSVHWNCVCCGKIVACKNKRAKQTAHIWRLTLKSGSAWVISKKFIIHP